MSLRIERIALIAVGAAFVSGCYQTVSGPDGGASADGASDGDTIAPDASDSCHLAGLLRCGSACPAQTCPSGQGCTTTGFCVPADQAGCNFRTTGTEDAMHDTRGCGDGEVCWFDHTTTPTDGEGSMSCRPPELCLLGADLVGEHSCFWPDATPVNYIPPRNDCPIFTTHPEGMCGNDLCARRMWGDCFQPTTGGTDSVCVGLSDQRGFGLCSVVSGVCDGSEGADFYTSFGSLVGETITCMRTLPPAATTTSNFGWWVPRAACDRYAAHFPGQVECVGP